MASSSSEKVLPLNNPSSSENKSERALILPRRRGTTVLFQYHVYNRHQSASVGGSIVSSSPARLYSAVGYRTTVHFRLGTSMSCKIGEQRLSLSWMLQIKCQEGVSSSDFLCSDRIMTGMTTGRSYFKCLWYSEPWSRCDIYVPSRRKSFSLIRWPDRKSVV